ncbi:efflux transporter outer membrane subunit [Sulfurospirillum barnesii]|uniref:Efflux transporter, outer membrane factor lipoprotein, NodT family n=1 Tax=Sulfurospirillum barnesii (strain ATCC 700032 / DSM 10660 / SES-3) TaxID=760154 RepID=I3Y0E6_SULBS|nr:efflux transporter outer membrane subunit [Sulfurospirillum barnesii]AFL69670.1 efflux transporter, outer membrane factor lipoprotein, NodT family [Sulfurospirillum barnesii SES-3]
MKRKYISISLLTMVILSGCSLSPTLQVPSIELPNKPLTALHVNEKWWTSFNDETLNRLIEEALTHNDDIKLSALRILKAKQMYGLSDANLYPSLNATGTQSRQKTSEETYQNKRYNYTDYSLGLSLQYEIDFWGKLSNQAESNWSLYLASKMAYQTVTNTLINDVIQAYLNLASLEERIKILDESIENYRQSYTYRSQQHQAGTINELLATQALAQYNNANASKGVLLETKTTQQSALAILLGKSPKELFDGEKPLIDHLPSPVTIPQGISSDLLENRPDIQESLMNLHSKNALIGVERSAYFPSISLTGSYGQQSESSSNLFQPTANKWGFGPTFTLPIFDFGKINTKVELSKTDLQSALISYEQTVKKAYKEVYDALSKEALIQNRLLYHEDEIKAYQKMLSITTTRFENGAANWLEVLDSQKSLLNASLNHTTTKQTLLVSQVELFKALGGGWNQHQ